MTLKTMPGKIRKSFLKRFKLAKSGVILRRKSGVNHFRVKQSKDLKRNKRNLISAQKHFIKYLRH